MNKESIFRSVLSETVFNTKYRHDGCETWEDLAKTLSYQVCGNYLPKDVVDEICQAITKMEFIPGEDIFITLGGP